MGKACTHALCSIVPPYVVDRLLEADDPGVRRVAAAMVATGAEARATRSLAALMPGVMATPSPAGARHRLVYDLEGRGMWALPGALVRSEGEGKTKDAAVDEAYRHAGLVYDFYRKVLGRNSLDDEGMSLISSVHLLRDHNNAYWNGEQMVYGDGDGRIFRRFTRALDVVGHEFTHGVVTHTANLVYRGQPGALNEHFADVFGVLVEQWHAKQTAKQANWLVGERIMGKGTKAKALRTFEAAKAYEDDPLLGTDPQPKHMDDLYRGSEDYGGVHINSGIPNHAFYVTATTLGGKAWTRAGRIWFDALQALGRTSAFSDMVQQTLAAATQRHGPAAKETEAVRRGWDAVGLL